MYTNNINILHIYIYISYSTVRCLRRMDAWFFSAVSAQRMVSHFEGVCASQVCATHWRVGGYLKKFAGDTSF